MLGHITGFSCSLWILEKQVVLMDMNIFQTPSSMWFEHMLGVLDITVDRVPRLLPLDGEIIVNMTTAFPQKARCVVGLQRGQSQEEGERTLPCSSVADRIAMSSLRFWRWVCLEQF